MYTQKYKTQGMALVEIIVSTAIITGGILALLASSANAVELSRQSLERIQASFIIEEGAEAVKTIRDTNWATISALTPGATYYLAFSSGAWSLSTTASQVDAFTRTITIANVNRDVDDDIALSGTEDPGTKLVTITVSWPSEKGVLSETISFYISDIWDDAS